MSLIFWKNFEKPKPSILQLVVLNHVESMQLPISHYDKSFNNFLSPNKQLKYRGKWGKIFVFQTFFRLNLIMSITKKIQQDSSLCTILLHQQHKFPICAIRRKYSETKNLPNNTFSNNFCHWNLNNKETFLFCFWT